VVENYDIAGGFASSTAKHTVGALGAFPGFGGCGAGYFTGLVVGLVRYPENPEPEQICQRGIVRGVG